MVTSTLTIFTILLKSTSATSTHHERSTIGFEPWSLKKLETPFVNFASVRKSTKVGNKSDIKGEQHFKVTFEVRLTEGEISSDLYRP